MNPLSLSTYSGNDISDLLREALLQLGLPREMLGKFESQSTLVAKLHDLPDIMISEHNDRLWIWSMLPGLSEARLFSTADQALAILMEPISNIEGSFLSLSRGNTVYELRGLVNLGCLSQETGIADLLINFKSHLERLCKIFEISGEYSA
ncbi:InvB/SpaK family type III secretion system chaperone [Chromobacterium vaccinii]|uniref:InvB/SpaK family type III secretion system chaperone n=1 Tax=Chromobacterium vaccinii TaxID=1108595 RepID=UPI000E2038F3